MKPASLRVKLLPFLLSGLFLAGAAPAAAQQPEEKKEPKPLTEGLPQRELSEKERERRSKKLEQELQTAYKKWLQEDVAYILTGEEKEAFLHLNSDEEREQFIEQFWLRRDPTPDTVENEFREEHYRRIAYANERFSSGKPGWRTDRGRIYIAWGPPDEIESHPSGGAYYRPIEEGGGSTSTYAFEIWRYRYLEGVGQEVILEFVDPSMSGEYRLTMDPSEKDALLNVPGAGLSFLEEMGLADKSSRFDRTDGTRLPLRPGELGNQLRGTRGAWEAFDRMQQYAAILKAPPVKFADLEALVTTRISFNLLPFDVRLDFLRVTDQSILVPVTVAIKKKDVTFQLKDGLHQSTINVFGRVTTMTGRIVDTFEDVLRLDVPPSLLERTLEERAVYQKALALRPGLYKLNLVLKDLNSGNIGTVEQRLVVPRFEENQLAHSSLILADLIERVPSRNVGSGQFVIGNSKVRPAVGETFGPNDRMGIYLQVYNLGVNDQTHKPDATIEYLIRQGEKTVAHFAENTTEMERAGEQITLEKVLALKDLAPGEYTLDIKVTDRVRQQSVTPSAPFRIVR
ncbi:MAG: GWxTD domain-containing protein [Acidobacteria bacterium RIFCSPHIGHO2_01_FULL_67_28]|nr:MAG: GWxTD domain-containing protein [Acidobacteria bacterium RIFCSPHIGHO2_01_FULL_67_28]